VQASELGELGEWSWDEQPLSEWRLRSLCLDTCACRSWGSGRPNGCEPVHLTCNAICAAVRANARIRPRPFDGGWRARGHHVLLVKRWSSRGRLPLKFAPMGDTPAFIVPRTRLPRQGGFAPCTPRLL